MFVVLKIMGNLVSIQSSLNNISADVNNIAETVSRNLTFILNALSVSSIHFTKLSIVLAKKNLGLFT